MNEIDPYDERSFTSVGALAELIQARLEPAQRDSGNYDKQDLMEEIRNAYAGVLFKVHMANMADGDRTAIEALLATKNYEATPETEVILLTGSMIVDLPRDAGIYQVRALDSALDCVATLTKSTPAAACAPESKFKPPARYYRIGMKMFFPDGLPRCTAFVQVIFYGLDTTSDFELLPRDLGDMAKDKVWQSLFPSKQVQADATVNENTNV